jgi:hypothetical protein
MGCPSRCKGEFEEFGLATFAALSAENRERWVSFFHNFLSFHLLLAETKKRRRGLLLASFFLQREKQIELGYEKDGDGTYVFQFLDENLIEVLSLSFFIIKIPSIIKIKAQRKKNKEKKKKKKKGKPLVPIPYLRALSMAYVYFNLK